VVVDGWVAERGGGRKILSQRRKGAKEEKRIRDCELKSLL
jgi:hypothetical protein